MLALILALAAAAPPSTPNTVSPLDVTALSKTGPIAATVEVAGDDGIMGADFLAVWPSTAYQTGTDGHVTLSCKVDTYGLAEWCQVASEAPRNKGLGKAALELRPTFKLAPAKSADGQPTSAIMLIKIAFKAPKRDLVGTEKSGAQVRGLRDIDGLIASQHSWTGNPLAMRAVTMMDDPIWVQAASFDDLDKAYPAKAAGVEGYVAAHCRVERSGADAGAMRECQVIKEAPGNLGFGKAALTLAPKFRVSPAAVARAPGHTPVWVDIPIRLPPPSTAAERTIMAPIWILGLDPKATPKVFPPEATAAGLTTGRGVARCSVAMDGAMKGCAPEAGEPDGLGFSEAAAKLASGMKMNLWSADGAPVEGGVVRIPIRLNLKAAN